MIDNNTQTILLKIPLEIKGNKRNDNKAKLSKTKKDEDIRWFVFPFTVSDSIEPVRFQQSMLWSTI